MELENVNQEDDGNDKVVFYDQFCFDFLKLFGIDQLQLFTPNNFVNIIRELFRIVTISVNDENTGQS